MSFTKTPPITNSPIMPDGKKHSEQLNHLLQAIADTAAEDASFADEVVRSANVDPDELAHQAMGEVRRMIAQAKLKTEETRRSTQREVVLEEAKRLRDKFGSAVKALKTELEEEGDLAFRFRKLEDQTDEEDAFAMLVEKIELELFGEDTDT